VTPSSSPLLSIIVPLLDEVDNVATLVNEIESVRSRLPVQAELILVDDGSRDDTWARIQAVAATRPWIRGLRFLANRGQTAAMAAGLDAARGELVAFLDGDLQNDPADLPAMIAPILAGQTDVVCGWRHSRSDNAITRTLPSAVANWIIRKSFRLPAHDLGCTLKVFRRVYLEEVILYGEMHRFILVYAQAQGARISEVEVNHRPRRFGHSKYGLTRIGKVLVDLLTVKMLNAYGSKPAYFFGKIALLFFALGFVAFSLVAYRVLILHRYEATPMVFIMVLMFITGLLCLTSGLLAEINIRVLHQVGQHRSYRVIETIGEEPAAGGEMKGRIAAR
jgi:glycosyltransferase involved in cell wall biosynthesis